MPRKTKLKEYEDRITYAQIARAKRNLISEKIREVYIDPYDFDGDMNHVIANLEDIRSTCVKKGYSNLGINYDAGWGDVSSSYILMVERTEMDSDVRTRLAARLQGIEEKKQAEEVQLEQEIETLKKLAKKHQKVLRDIYIRIFMDN